MWSINARKNNEYKKKNLDQRMHKTSKGEVQRDLYSSFLYYNLSDDLISFDRQKCFDTFDNFLKNHNDCIEKIKASKAKRPKSFGF